MKTKVDSLKEFLKVLVLTLLLTFVFLPTQTCTHQAQLKSCSISPPPFGALYLVINLYSYLELKATDIKFIDNAIEREGSFLGALLSESGALFDHFLLLLFSLLVSGVFFFLRSKELPFLERIGNRKYRKVTLFLLIWVPSMILFFWVLFPIGFDLIAD